MKSVSRFAACVAAAFLSTAAQAAPVIDLSRTAIDGQYVFGEGVGAPGMHQMVMLTNVGTDPLVVQWVAIDVSGNLWSVSGPCTFGATLAPGERCPIAIKYGGLIPAANGVGIVSNAAAGPSAITMKGYTIDASAAAARGFPLPDPTYRDFGTQPTGVASAPAQIRLTNIGKGADTRIQALSVGGRHPGDFTVGGTCQVGTTLAKGASCTFDVQFRPLGPGPRSAEIYVTDASLGQPPFPIALTGHGVGAAVPAVAQAVEYYHAGFDHYFITHLATEIAVLDAGVQIKGWVRTGQTIPVGTAADAQTSPVCRFYIPPALGDSHFYGRGTAECTATGEKNPSFVNEDPQFFHTRLPAAGICPAGTVPIHRVFSNRPDANHRYLTDKALRDQMVGKGWLAEGDGPDLVVMCGPQ